MQIVGTVLTQTNMSRTNDQLWLQINCMEAINKKPNYNLICVQFDIFMVLFSTLI